MFKKCFHIYTNTSQLQLAVIRRCTRRYLSILHKCMHVELHWNHLATYVDATCGACTVFIPLATAYEGKNIRLRYIPVCHCLEFNFIKWEDFSYWVLVLWTKHPESNTFRIKTMQVSLQIDLLTRVISFLFSALLQRPMNINAKHYYILLSFSLPASKLPW